MLPTPCLAASSPHFLPFPPASDPSLWVFPRAAQLGISLGGRHRPGAGRGALTPRLLCRPALCSWVLGNGHLLSPSGASGLSLGSLLFLPEGRGNYSSALASWLSPASGERGLGRGRRRPQVSPAGWRQHRRPELGLGRCSRPTCAAQRPPLQGQEGPPFETRPGPGWTVPTGGRHGAWVPLSLTDPDPARSQVRSPLREQGDAHFPLGEEAPDLCAQSPGKGCSATLVGAGSEGPPGLKRAQSLANQGGGWPQETQPPEA